MAPRRNIVLVVAHGLRSDAVSDSNTWPLSTPSLAKLAGHGLRLVATSACPADGGGLVSLLTGLHARQHGYVDQTADRVTCEGWPAWLAAAGYHVAGVGCVGAIEPFLHEAVLVEPVGALEPVQCAYLSTVRQKGMLSAVQQQRKQRARYGVFEPDRLLLEPEDDIDGFIAAEARRLLSRMPGDRPWALIVMFSGPGNDLPPPTIYSDVTDPRALEEGFLPANFAEVDALAELDYPRVLLQRLEPHAMGRIRADYLGRVSLIDFGVGRLMSLVEARPDRQRTWMLVASDRGQLLGEHGLIGHRSFLCGALETPLIVAPPLVGPASASELGEPLAARADLGTGFVSTVDVAATVAGLGGCDPPKAVAGRSVLPVFAGESLQLLGPNPAEGGLLSEFGRRLLLETERHKVIFDIETRAALGLYDLINDPDEQQNLVSTPTGQNLLDSLRWRLGNALLPLRALPGSVPG